MELVTSIVDALKEIIEEDKKQEQPLFLKVADSFIMNIARKVVQEKKKTFLIGITGESASGKTVFVDNTIEAVLREKKEGIYSSGILMCLKNNKQYIFKSKNPEIGKALYEILNFLKWKNCYDEQLNKNNIVLTKNRF